jgi:hypothetical protein
MVFGVGYALQHFEGFYEKDVQAHMRAPLPLKLEPVGKNSTQDIVQETDLRPLPAVVQNYLRYCGAVGKPKVRTMRLVFRGQMRGEKDGKPDDWFAFRSVQYNFFEDPARLFFMKAHMWGMPVWGYHDYQHGAARMRIKPLGLFMAAHMEGPVADKTETVTYFNDLCLFAPAALIDNRIRWQPMDGLRAGATYTNGTISIQAVLYFNTSGQLVNFTSDDRSEISIGKPRPFSTPVRAYKDFDGRRIPTYGEAIWHDGPKAFVYGKFWLESIEYNVETSGEGNEIQTR